MGDVNDLRQYEVATWSRLRSLKEILGSIDLVDTKKLSEAGFSDPDPDTLKRARELKKNYLRAVDRTLQVSVELVEILTDQALLVHANESLLPEAFLPEAAAGGLTYDDVLGAALRQHNYMREVFTFRAGCEHHPHEKLPYERGLKALERPGKTLRQLSLGNDLSDASFQANCGDVVYPQAELRSIKEKLAYTKLKHVNTYLDAVWELIDKIEDILPEIQKNCTINSPLLNAAGFLLVRADLALFAAECAAIEGTPLLRALCGDVGPEYPGVAEEKCTFYRSMGIEHALR